MGTRTMVETDVCVVGGGMAGLAAALAAARHGSAAVLMHDRPVLGGNASSECRVHICGADRHNANPNARETGILEELRLTNLAINPQRSFGVFDTVLYDAARRQDNLTLMLNCSACEAEMDGRRIVSVTGWQTTTQTWRTVRAKVFIDCSGDAVLAPLTGAPFRVGREGRDEFGESLAPEKPDAGTMGMTLAFMAVECASPQPFRPPSWARVYPACADLPDGVGGHNWLTMGYWWNELGGLGDSIADTERIRDDLLASLYGVWDHVKNRCPQHRDRVANWALDWVQFLPAKRESRRYLARTMLNQNDVLSGGDFPDKVAYGGWTIDEHPPCGIAATARLGLHASYHAKPPLYGIPYRSLVSAEVANLMFAGRCAGCTHIAMSSTRVMGTGAVMGQAAGTAAAMAVARRVDPAGIEPHAGELQQVLLADDAYLPGVPMRFNEMTARASLTASSGDPAPLRDGINRPVGDDQHAWSCSPGDWLEIHLAAPAVVERLTVIADSRLDLEIQMSYWQRRTQIDGLPAELLRDATVEVRAGGAWTPVAAVADNTQRMVRIPVGRRTDALRLRIGRTWGAERTRLFAVWVD